MMIFVHFLASLVLLIFSIAALHPWRYTIQEVALVDIVEEHEENTDKILHIISSRYAP